MSLVDSSKVTGSNCDVRKETVLFEWTLTTVITRLYVHAIGNIVVESDENSMEPSFVSLKAVEIKTHEYFRQCMESKEVFLKMVNKRMETNSM